MSIKEENSTRKESMFKLVNQLKKAYGVPDEVTPEYIEKTLKSKGIRNILTSMLKGDESNGNGD